MSILTGGENSTMNLRCAIAFFVGIAAAGIYSVAPQAFARGKTPSELTPPAKSDEIPEVKRTSSPSIDKPSTNALPRRKS